MRNPGIEQRDYFAKAELAELDAAKTIDIVQKNGFLRVAQQYRDLARFLNTRAQRG